MKVDLTKSKVVIRHEAPSWLLKAALAAVIALSSLSCDGTKGDSYQGYIEGDYLYISSPVGGTVQNVPVGKGDTVRAGDLLFELDPEPELAAFEEAAGALGAARALYEDKKKGQRPPEIAQIEALIARAEAALALSEKEFERASALFDKDIIAEEKLDAARTVYQSDRAAVEELKARLRAARLGARSGQIEAAWNEVKRAEAAFETAMWRLGQKRASAPEDAIVFDVFYDTGEFAAPGYPVVALLPPMKVKARFFVPEPELSSIVKGQKAYVFIDGLGAPVEGTVTYISPEAEYTPPFIYSKDNRSKLVFMAEASFPAEIARGLNPGQPLEVRLAP